MKRLLEISIAALLIGLSVSCSFEGDKKDDQVLARVGKHNLYRSDLLTLFKSGMSPVDSALLAENFINNWAKKKVLLEKAQLNLSIEESNFEKLIEDYREGLISNAYKQKLIAQYLDTVVSKSELQRYYNENRSNFILNSDILMLKYASFSSSISNKDEIVKLMKSNSAQDLKKLEEICYQMSYNFGISDSTWIQVSELRFKLPGLKDVSDEMLLKKESFIEKQDSINLYLTRVLDHKGKKEISPLKHVESRVKNIILNRRKLELLKKIEDQMLKDAIKNGEFEIFK